jgi:FdhD protein
MINKPTIPIEIHKYSNNIWSVEHGSVPVEMLVMLTVNGEPWVEFMCTPEYLEALAAGFLFNEGLIENASEIAQIQVCQEGTNVDIWTTTSIKKPIRWRMTSGCSGGITAGINVEAPGMKWVMQSNDNAENFDTKLIKASGINILIRLLLSAQRLHKETGGIHASALSDGKILLLFCEDIGRHNTLDKLAGRVLLEHMKIPYQVILTTGRISSEMLQKAARLRVDIVVSYTAPTSLAIQLANERGITLIGYAHGDRYKIYTHPVRVEMK